MEILDRPIHPNSLQACRLKRLADYIKSVTIRPNETEITMEILERPAHPISLQARLLTTRKLHNISDYQKI